MIKSPIKWAGGKSYLLDTIKTELSKFNSEIVFVEPFCGSAVLSINLNSHECLASDINFPLINFFRHVKDGYDCNYLNPNLTEEEYYRIRQQYNDARGIDLYFRLDKLHLAKYFYYLNKTGYNGLYRENKKGEYNVPWGKRKKMPLIQITPDQLKHIQFAWVLDYRFLNIPDNSFLYLDPPYDQTFTSYCGSKDFNWNEQVRLVEWAISQNKPFILSNQATDRIIELYESHDLKLRIFEAPRKINRSRALEVLASNY